MYAQGAGAVFSQVVEIVQLCISAASLVKESKYSAIKNKCWAIKWAILAFRIVEMGLHPLSWPRPMPITHWNLALKLLRFKVVPRPGAQMAVTKVLSYLKGWVEVGDCQLQAESAP